MSIPQLSVRHGRTDDADARAAVAAIVDQIRQPAMSGVLFFCSAHYDLAVLGAAIAEALPDTPVIGCTSAGQFGPGGFQRGGMSAVSLASPELVMTPHVIHGLGEARSHAATLARTIHARPARPPGWHAFALILVDGLAMAEERLVAALYENLSDIALVGGSAGDDLRFEQTFIYHRGRFHSDAALVTVFDTRVPFEVFRFQHFEPTATSLVITDADPEIRVVREINGEPAALAYAAAVGVAVEGLTAQVFSSHPLLVKIGGAHYVRSIQQANPDHSLTLFCAIEDGLVVYIGRGIDICATAAQALRLAATNVAATMDAVPPAFVLGCDCILRRLEFENSGIAAEVGTLYAEHGVFGFSTYGEQYKGIHVNQTFTGVAFGGAR